jgi:DNA-binding IclR family transcriptional regulator
MNTRSERQNLLKACAGGVYHWRVTYPKPPMPKKALQQSVADTNAAPGGAAAVDRALSILGSFDASRPTQTLAEIADRTMLYKSTVLRLLASLEHARLIQHAADGRYTIGPEVARLYGVYSASFSLDTVVLPVMQELVRETRESASLHVRQGDQRVCLFRIDSPQPIRDHIRAGDLLPLDRGAGGRVILAFSGESGPIYDEIRARKVMSSSGDRSEGVAGISAPVFDATGKLVGALTLTMPAARFQESYEASVRQAALDITRGLGGPVQFYD